jgi:hypothetical protein
VSPSRIRCTSTSRLPSRPSLASSFTPSPRQKYLMTFAVAIDCARRRARYVRSHHRWDLDEVQTQSKYPDGHTLKTSCGACGFSERSFHDYCAKNPAFLAATQHARAAGRVKIVDSILADKDWRAKAWYLERTDPASFGRTAERALPVEPDDPDKKKINVAIVCNITKPLEELLNFPTEGDVQPSPFPLVVEPEYRFNRRTVKGEPIEPLPEINDESEPEQTP